MSGMEEGTVILEGDAGGRVWAARCGRAAGFFDRLRGLLGRAGTGPGEALLIERCGAVHTVGMRFPLDLVFVDASWRVTRVVRRVRPGRPAVCGGRRAARVFESEAGRLDLDGLASGSVLRWLPKG